MFRKNCLVRWVSIGSSLFPRGEINGDISSNGGSEIRLTPTGGGDNSLTNGIRPPLDQSDPAAIAAPWAFPGGVSDAHTRLSHIAGGGHVEKVQAGGGGGNTDIGLGRVGWGETPHAAQPVPPASVHTRPATGGGLLIRSPSSLSSSLTAQPPPPPRSPLRSPGNRLVSGSAGRETPRTTSRPPPRDAPRS